MLTLVLSCVILNRWHDFNRLISFPAAILSFIKCTYRLLHTLKHLCKVLASFSYDLDGSIKEISLNMKALYGQNIEDPYIMINVMVHT